jgi:hypothetical protein
MATAVSAVIMYMIDKFIEKVILEEIYRVDPRSSLG